MTLCRHLKEVHRRTFGVVFLWVGIGGERGVEVIYALQAEARAALLDA